MNFLGLAHLGAMEVDETFVILSQLSTSFYFSYFLFIMPSLSFIEENILYIDKKNIRKIR